MSRSRQTLFLLVVLGSLGATACGPALSRYRYISLSEVPGIQVGERGAPGLPGLRFASAMPLDYALERGGYRLHFQHNRTSHAPALGIRAEAPGGGGLRLVARRSRRGDPARAAPCDAYYPASGAGELDFAWDPACAGAAAEARFISFDVLSEDGRLLGREDLPFALQANGILLLRDLL